MTSSFSDWLHDKHKQDFASLRHSRRRSVRLALVGICLFLAFFLLSSGGGRGEFEEDLSRTRAEIESIGTSWALSIVEQYDSCRDWLLRHGTSLEVYTYDRISSLVMNGSLRSSGGQAIDRLSFPRRTALSFYSALGRVGFLVTASMRIWLLVLVLGTFWGLSSRRAYQGADILGQTGNDRLFFSGAQISLNARSESGASDMQITGLACPRSVSATVAAKSGFQPLLEKFGAANETNLGLVAILLAHAEYPAYVARVEEEARLAACYQGASLPGNALLILEKALTLHSCYQFDALSSHQHSEAFQPRTDKFDKFEYAFMLEDCFQRVLTPAMRRTLSGLTAAEVATVVLAIEAGKVLASRHEGGKWFRTSNYVHLCARAVLHSLPAWATDYGYGRREELRRGLIYASRSSSYAPVRFPVDLSDGSRALRQWVEILTLLPHELRERADEVELFGLMAELESAWRERFFELVQAGKPQELTDTYGLSTGMLFVPLKLVLKLMPGILSEEAAKRLDELVNGVSLRQQQQTASRDATAEGERPAPAVQERILAPVSEAEIERLAALHALPKEDIKAWSALRVVLNSSGWLGRRVGDYTVPESSLIFAVFEMPGAQAGYQSQNKRRGLPGMVALRSTRLESAWGRSWFNRFARVDAANMAESREDFEKLLAGEKLSVEVEPEEVTEAV